MMKQRWGLDRNVLRPTPGDPRGAEQHHWNSGAKENQQLNPGGPSNRQKKKKKKKKKKTPAQNQLNSLHNPIKECISFFWWLSMYKLHWISCKVNEPRKFGGVGGGEGGHVNLLLTQYSLYIDKRQEKWCQLLIFIFFFCLEFDEQFGITAKTEAGKELPC